MSSGTEKSTVHSEAEAERCASLLQILLPSKHRTEAGDTVKYSGNPAEIPGARYETRKALRRAGVFSLLVEHNASRLKNGTICVSIYLIVFRRGGRRTIAADGSGATAVGSS